MSFKCIICKKITPNFGLRDDKIAEYCFNCKKEGMIDIKHKKCIICNNKRPTFGLPGDKIAEYCFNCKKEGMIDIKRFLCIICNNKRPTFGLPGDKKAEYCFTCKKDGMVDITNSKCIECKKTIPVFGFPTDKICNYCSKCKKEGMINLRDPKCIECKKTIPVFGFPTDKIRNYCSKCKKEGMINLKDSKCIECKKTIPVFGFPTDKIRNYCSKCKKEGMINLKDPKCKSDWCITLSNKKYDGYCCYCFMHLFPDKQVSRNYKTKEKYVVDYIKEQFKEIDIIADKQIHGGCSKRRPDILIDLGHQIIIVEIDENQHINYDCSCENKRIMELSQDVGHRPIIFIRFNPDDYKINLKNITSCWSQGKHGIYTIKKCKQEEWNERLIILKEQINYWLINKTSKLIEIIQLFYDQ